MEIDMTEKKQAVRDKEKLQAKFAAAPEAVEQFFTTDDQATGAWGLAARLNAAIDRFAGEGDSLLLTRNQTLQSKIESNFERIEFLNHRLDAERERLKVIMFW